PDQDPGHDQGRRRHRPPVSARPDQDPGGRALHRVSPPPLLQHLHAGKVRRGRRWKRAGVKPMKKRWPGFLLFAVLLLAWELSSAWKLVDPISVPRVSAIVAAWFETLQDGQLLRQLLPSLWRIFAGFGLAVFIAV